MNYIEVNKALWNAKTDIHFNSDFYNVNAFLKGSSSLNSIELELLGNVNNKTILHLQCHFGMDTISLTRLGATTTGVDFSEKSIERANELKAKTNASTQFILSDIYSLNDKINKQFDIIYTSYGVIGWLPDLNKWGNIISKFLKPGGKFIMVEFHPVVWMFSYDFKKIEFNYSDTKPIIEELEGTYTDRNAHIKNKSISWNHGLSKVFNSLIDNGLSISEFNEYNYSPYNCFENTVAIDKNKYQIKGLENKIPLTYSIIAKKNNNS